jgi:hypothetical protein
MIGQVAGGVKLAGPRDGQGKKGFPKGKKTSVSFPLGYGTENGDGRNPTRRRMLTRQYCSASMPQERLSKISNVFG